MTTFEKVSALNLAFGNVKGNVLDPNKQAILNQAFLCLEEAKEMIEEGFPGIKLTIDVDKGAWDGSINLKEVLDAQGDLTTVNDGVAHIVGVDGNRVYDKVDASNRTKFIRCQEEVGPAIQHYIDKGFQGTDLYLEGKYPEVCIKVAGDVMVNGKFYPKGKFLKNVVTFQEPDFSDILSGN